jgi:hypothetical protein
MFIAALFTVTKLLETTQVQLMNKFRKCGRKNLCGLKVNWMHLEDMILSDASQVQKDKGHMFSLICGRWIQKINIYSKTNMIIYTFICRTCL